MILNRLKRGQADPEELEALSNKVRSRAIETRRITHRMLRAGPPPPEAKKDPSPGHLSETPDKTR